VLNLRCKLNSLNEVIREIPIRKKRIYLRITADKRQYLFSYSEDGNTYKDITRLDTRYLSTETSGGYNGVMLGLYAYGEKTVADFDWFEYSIKENKEWTGLE